MKIKKETVIMKFDDGEFVGERSVNINFKVGTKTQQEKTINKLYDKVIEEGLEDKFHTYWFGGYGLDCYSALEDLDKQDLDIQQETLEAFFELHKLNILCGTK